MRAAAIQPVLVSKQEAARYCGVSVRTFDELCHAQGLEPIHVGPALRYRVSDLEAIRGAFSAPPPDPIGRVYFIQAGEGGPIKIGYATDVRSRMDSLQTANAEELRSLGSFQGTPQAEFETHVRFRALRIRGEWFRPERELLDFIAVSVQR